MTMSEDQAWLSELINFREFGGFATAAGRVRSHLLYRSGHFGKLSAVNQPKVLALDFATIVDLRYAGERDADVSPWGKDRGDCVLFHDGDRLKESPHIELLRTNALTPSSARDFYLTLYKELPFDPLYRELFAATVRRIAVKPGRVLIHCSAGKDRTGIFCALLLNLLGVSPADIESDYLASKDAPGFDIIKTGIAVRVEAKYGYTIPSEALDALLGVALDYIQMAFDTIVSREGSVENYFVGAGVTDTDIELLRARLIEADIKQNP